MGVYVTYTCELRMYIHRCGFVCAMSNMHVCMYVRTYVQYMKKHRRYITLYTICVAMCRLNNYSITGLQTRYKCVCVRVPIWGTAPPLPSPPPQHTPPLTMDVNHNECTQSNAGHGRQLPSHQSHNLVNLAVAELKVFLQSALLDGLCDCSGPVHGTDGNDNLKTDRQTVGQA